MVLLIDHVAKQIALTRWALPDCLHVPIAAANEDAIKNYIGETEVIVDGTPPKALIVKTDNPPSIDPELPVWELPSSRVLFSNRQVWVHIAFSRYRNAYKKVLPGDVIEGKVLSHAMNRRTAALKGFAYVRITPTSRGCNSSSAFSENWAVDLHSFPEQPPAAKRQVGPFIQYADLSDLMVMLDTKIGGGVMAIVNEGQRLVRPQVS